MITLILSSFIFLLAPPGQGKCTDYHDAQDFIKEKTKASWKLDTIAEEIPKFWAEREGWV
jgi:hypothetical protein